MKTVHEYLCEIDSEELANQYMVDFPPDDLEWLSHKDMLIGEYYDHRKQAIRKFIDKLRSIEPCATEDGEKKIFIVSRKIKDFCKDVDFGMVYEKELKKDISSAKLYSCVLTPHEEILGYYVADNKLTQHYLDKLLSFLIHEALISGFDQERREEIIRSLEEAEEQARNHPESVLSMEEVDQMLHEEFGYIANGGLSDSGSRKYPDPANRKSDPAENSLRIYSTTLPYGTLSPCNPFDNKENKRLSL